jgi:hypothetical protein
MGWRMHEQTDRFHFIIVFMKYWQFNFMFDNQRSLIKMGGYVSTYMLLYAKILFKNIL